MEIVWQILEYFTYSPRDVLHFSARTYFRLFEASNRALWPFQLALLGAGAALLALVARPQRLQVPPAPGSPAASSALARLPPLRPDQQAAAMLAVAWFVAAHFHLARQLATVHLAGMHFAWAFGLEAALLLALGFAAPLFARGAAAPSSPRVLRRAGAAIVAFAVFAYPLIAPVCGRPWAQAEFFALAPDPTVAATLGALLAHGPRGWRGAVLMVLPLAWCAITGVTLRTLGAPEFWVLPAVGAGALLFAVARPARRRAGDIAR